MSRPRLLALLLGLVTLVAYLPVLRCDFVDFDDDDYVTKNAMVQHGLTPAGVVWAFKTVYAENWHPLTWLSHMADCQFFGLNPHLHHLVNSLFHVANSMLLFALLFRLTAQIWPSLLAAALFAWHPLHVESVAWIAERKDVLSTCFALLALLSYARYAQENRRRDYWLALVWFALGLLSKPMVVTLPFVMLLLDFWPLQRFAGGPLNAGRTGVPEKQTAHSALALAVEKWPFFALAIASCVITVMAQSQSFHGQTAMAPLAVVPLTTRLENIPVAYFMYLLKLFWPVKLAVFYPLANAIPAAPVAGAALFLLAVSAVIWRSRRACPCLWVGWLWFLGTLVPVIGLVQVGGAAMADRYSYLPSVGIFMVIAFAAAGAAERFPGLNKLLIGAAVIILAGCLGLSERQLSFWRDSETLFRHALAVTADNDVARNNLGYILEARGRLPEALAEYRAAAALNPGAAVRHNNLANVLDLLGRPAESLAEYRKAIQLVPGDASQHTGAGYELGELGQYDAALEEFAIAEKLAPGYLAPHLQAAQVYFKMGRDADGINEFRAILQMAPDNWQMLSEAAYYLAANANAGARNGATAMKLAAKANILTSGSVASVCDVLGMACAEAGDFADAEASVQHAIKLATAAHQTDLGSLEQRLELYRQHQPWHESFRVPGAVTNNVSAPAP